MKMGINRSNSILAVILSALLCVPSIPNFIAPTPAPSISTRRLADKTIKSVVLIHVTLAKGGFIGSGVIISPDGYIVTCAHVVGHDNMKNLTVQTWNGDSETPVSSAAKVVVIDRQNDLAIIKLAGNNKHLHYAKLGNSDKVRIGDEVMAIGFPLGLPWTVTTGIISALRFREGFLQTSAAINPGNSGGPLFNQKGEVIGINARMVVPVMFVPASCGLGLSITSNQVKTLLNFIDMDVE